MKGKLNFIHPWDMERCSKIYPIPKNWNETPNGDDEWIYMRSRLGYFDGLILMYKMTKDKKYYHKIHDIIEDYITHHKVIKYEKSTRTLDSGIRLVNLLRTIIFFKENELKFDKNIIEHMSKTCDYLFESYISKYDQSNWGFIQMAGIYVYSLYFGDEEKKKKSFGFLQKQLKAQILADALHWEKSMTYHCQIMIYLLFIIYISRKVKEKVNITLFENYLKKVSSAAEKLHYPDNTQINFGDSDDNEIESILSLVKYIFHEKSEYKITGISKMFIPEAGVKYVKKDVKRSTAFFADSGYVHIRDNNFSFSAYLTPMSSSHTHIDYLHFNYYYKTKIFVDSGRYSYAETEERKYLKSLKAHNGMIIDENEGSKILSSWEYEGYPDVFPICLLRNEDGQIVKMAVFDNKNQALMTRCFVVIKENVIIINKVKCKGKHNLSMYYHLYPDTRISEEKNGIILNGETRFLIDKYKIEQSIYSPEYNKIKKSYKICKNSSFEDEYHEINCILKKDVNINKLAVFQDKKKVYDNIAVAFQIKAGEDSYILFVKQREIYSGQKVFHVDDIPFYESIKIIKE